jgi:hypothetical protein
MSKKRLLILSANPRDTTRLRLDIEVREIEEGLRRSKKREKFTIAQKWAVRLRDLRRAMLDYEPHIVHFCGHGEENGIIVEDEQGKATAVEPEALAGLFELFKHQVECVLLNACYSQLQAEAINKYIRYVIGMSRGISDKTAIEFAIGFYDALGTGKPFEEAFRFGCNALQLHNIPEHLVPILKERTELTGEPLESVVIATEFIEPEKRERFFKELIDPKAIAEAMAERKDALMESLDKGLRYEIELLSALDTLTLNITTEDGKKVLETLKASPSPGYAGALYAYMKGKPYEQKRVDSYVTLFVISRTKKVFLEFYTSENIQQVIAKCLRKQIERAKTKLAAHEYLDDGKSIKDLIDNLLDGGLIEVIRNSVMSRSFEESMLQVLNELKTDAIVGAVVGTTIVSTLVVLGFSLKASLAWFLIPAIAVIITYKSLTFKKSFGEKVSKKITEAVSHDFFSQINDKVTKMIADAVVTQAAKFVVQ